MTLTFSELTNPTRRHRLDDLIACLVTRLEDEAPEHAKLRTKRIMSHALANAAREFSKKFESTGNAGVHHAFERHVLEECNRSLIKLRGLPI